MGTDDLHKKRRERNARSLARGKARRAPYARVLIVCEGEKTEPGYFREIRDAYKLNTANIEISGDCGSDPCGIFKYAKSRYGAEKSAGNPFDKVFCVFDRDSHLGYQKAVADIRRTTPKGVFEAITSVPCFEYWLLLHFRLTTRPYTPVHSKSACSQVISELKKAGMPNYTKGQGGVFTTLKGQLENAKKNSAAALQAARENDTDNPSTRIHELVEYLQKIKA